MSAPTFPLGCSEMGRAKVVSNLSRTTWVSAEHTKWVFQYYVPFLAPHPVKYIKASGQCISAAIVHRQSSSWTVMSYEIGLATPDTPNRGFPLWLCSVLMVILAGIFVLLRLAIRFHRGRLGWDDWTILTSLICSVLLTITECSGMIGQLDTRQPLYIGLSTNIALSPAVHNGYGKHASDLSHAEQIRALKWFFGAQVVYKIVITVNKVSFFCLYLRIFTMPTFRRICFIGIGVVTSWGLAYVLVTIFQCKPIASFWDKGIKSPKCLDNEAMWMSYSVINIIFDLIILTLPVKPIRQMRLPKAKKIGLLVIFAMGTL